MKDMSECTYSISSQIGRCRKWTPSEREEVKSENNRMKKKK